MENWRRRIARERGWYDEDFPGASEERGSLRARVYTATELTPELREVLATKLRGVFDSDVSLAYKTDSSILGGMVLQIGSRVVDMSVSGELRRLGLKVQEVIGTHLNALADSWTTDEDEALIPDHAYFVDLARNAALATGHQVSTI